MVYKISISHTQSNKTHRLQLTFPSSMVSHVALFLPTGLSSISCMETSYSPSKSWRRLLKECKNKVKQDKQTLNMIKD